MTASALLTIGLINLIGALSPGPDFLLTVRVATRSRRHALASVAGMHVSVLMWMVFTVAGAAAVFAAFPGILWGIQLLGGFYLAYVGVRMAQGGLIQRSQPMALAPDADLIVGKLWQNFLRGMGSNLSNPKIVINLSSMVAPLLPGVPTLAEGALIVAVLWIPSLLLFLFFATVISTQAIRRRLLAIGPWIDIVAGAIFVIIGVVLIGHGLAAML